MSDPATRWPELAADLDTLEREVEGKRRALSDLASRDKRRFNTSQWVVVLGGVVLIALGATQAALVGEGPMLGLSVAKAVLGFALGVIVLLGQELGWQREWLDRRATSEQLKHEFYFFLGRVGEYSRADDPLRLLQRRVQNIEKEYEKKRGATG